MNTKTCRIKSFHRTRIMAVLLAGVVLISKTPAQPAAQPVDNRFLLIFDTSSDMKKRLPEVERALDTLLASNMQGQMHAGDSIGVWLFDRELHSEHLMQRWVPEDAATIASTIIRFVGRQHYSKRTSFDALRPSLHWVVQNSDRLTVLIFCDGDGQISGTPFDSGINRIFQERQAGSKAARQPFIIVLRSQLGNYVGCTVNLPPAVVGFPAFPALPQPPVAPTNAAPPPPSKPIVEAPPLIIIGTKTETNLPPPEPKPAPLLTTNQPPPATAVTPTNAIANGETNLPAPVATTAPTNAPATAPAGFAVPAAAAQTNVMAASQEKSGLSFPKALAIGAVFLILAGALTILMLGRLHKTGHGSLITRSMNKSGRPPVQSANPPHFGT